MNDTWVVNLCHVCYHELIAAPDGTAYQDQLVLVHVGHHVLNMSTETIAWTYHMIPVRVGYQDIVVAPDVAAYPDELIHVHVGHHVLNISTETIACPHQLILVHVC